VGETAVALAVADAFMRRSSAWATPLSADFDEPLIYIELGCRSRSREEVRMAAQIPRRRRGVSGATGASFSETSNRPSPRL
jgi:hypothetical protein